MLHAQRLASVFLLQCQRHAILRKFASFNTIKSVIALKLLKNYNAKDLAVGAYTFLNIEKKDTYKKQWKSDCCKSLKAQWARVITSGIIIPIEDLLK